MRGIGAFTGAKESWDVVADDVATGVGVVIVCDKRIIGAATVDVIVVVVCTWFEAFSEKAVIDPTKSVTCKFGYRRLLLNQLRSIYILY